MAVHTPHVAVPRATIAVAGHGWMLVLGSVAVLVLVMLAVLTLAQLIGSGTDANILQVERLSEMRNLLGGGGFI